MHSQIIASEIRNLRFQISQTMPDNPVLFGWAAYSQCDEDGIVRECLNRIAKNTNLSQTFVEVGCANGLENNTHFMLLDGFRGVWIDGDEEKIHYIDEVLGGTTFERLWVVNTKVSLDSAELLAQRTKRFLGVESLDFLSLDIDGNDLHVLPFFLQELKPKLLCLEYNAKFPPPSRLAMQYNDNHCWLGNDYFGVSLQSWVDLLVSKGYTLVCCNLSGANAFFVRDDLLNGFTSYSIDLLYQPPRYFLIEAPKGHASSLLWLKQYLQNTKPEQLCFVPAVINSVTVDFAIHSGTDQYISDDIARDGVWEPFESKVFSSLCKPADFVLDIGANIGWYAVLAARIVGKAGCVWAFEPDEKNARLLEINAAVLDNNGVVQVYCNAVGDSETEALIYKSETNLGDHRLFSDGFSRETCVVKVTTLDGFFAKEHKVLPNIIKSDTQGSEGKILRGAQKLFTNGWRPIMILEFWPFGLEGSGDNPFKFWQDLVQLGYEMFEIYENNPQLVPICFERLQMRLQTDISPSSGGHINFLCMPHDSDRFALIENFIASSEGF